MSRAILVVDLGLGDSGKGTITDWLVRRSEARTVVRYNGGAQAAHNVVSPDGRHHTFAQFGSGTFAGARTHLGPLMMLNPLSLLEEARSLQTLGVSDPLSLLTVDERTLVTTPYQVAMNRLREISRGQGKHGSCGMGVGETMWDHVQFDLRVQAQDLRERATLLDRLEALRRHKLQQAEALSLPDSEEARAELGVLRDQGVAQAFADVADSLCGRLKVVDPAYLAFVLSEGTTVFEGAQGVLLDEWFGFHPYTTWSTTTLENAERLLAETGFEGAVERFGVIRGYQTRHGAGPFPTENESLTQHLPDLHNGNGRWQEHFRSGWLDLTLLRYAQDVVCKNGPPVDRLAVTGLDRMTFRAEWPVAVGYHGAPLELFEPSGRIRVGVKDDLERQETLTRFLEHARPRYQDVPLEGYLDFVSEQLGLPVAVASYGPTAEDKVALGPTRSTSTAE